MAIQGKEWLYYLIDSMGRAAQIENGLVVFKANFKSLVYTPDGWQDISIGWERNLTKFGINRNFSLPLGFVLDGKYILDYLALNKNFDEKLYMLIQKQFLSISQTNYYYYYDKFYKGELDLTTIDSEENKTTVNIMEGSLSKNLKAYEGQNYEFPIDDPEAISVRMNGIDIRYEFRFFHFAGFDSLYTTYSLGFNEGLNQRNYFMNFSRADTTGQLIGVATFDVIKTNAGGDLSTANNFYFLEAVTNITLHATFHFKGRMRKQGSPQTCGWRIDVYNQNNTIVHTILNESSNLYEQPFDVTTNVDLNLAEGDRLFLIARVSRPGADGPPLVFLDVEESACDFNFFSSFISSTIKALKPYTLYKRLIGRITGSETNALSTLLEAYPNLVVTCGDAIRGLDKIPDQRVVIKTNLNDFFTSYNAVLSAGMGIENNKVVFEGKEHFFDESNPIHLGKVRNFKWKLATELLVNSIKVGWPNQTYEDVNGRQEFNTTQERGSVVQRVSKTLELVSVYRADPFGIEFTRINLEGKITTDSSSDNDVFILNVDLSSQNDDGSYNLKREAYDSIDGLLSPSSIFNIEELTPARLLKKHASWINSVFYGFEGSKLTYQTSDKNRELRTVKGTEVYDEDADVTITSSPRLLKPILFEFEPETLSNLVELMEENPNRCFSFEHPNGNIYKGFNMKIGIAPNNEESQAFQLISAPSNDLKTLINHG